jgi:hypothetical protein
MPVTLHMARLARYHSQWAAQFYVAAELSRRGYVVAPTLGHAPATDLLAQTPTGQTFAIEVKGQQGHSDWFIQKPSRTSATVYVLVAVPTADPERPGAPRFFLLTARDVRVAMGRYLKDRKRRGTSMERWKWAIRWKDALPHENAWSKVAR